MLLFVSFVLFIKPSQVKAFAYQDNYVKFNFVDKNPYTGSVFLYVSFTPEKVCVTPGQDRKGYFASTIGKTQTILNGWEFYFNCGRKGSNEVANWFNHKTFNGWSTSFNHPAGNLNFAVEGKLRLVSRDSTILIDNFLLAQGHKNLSNNWWVGQEFSNGCGVNNTIKLKGKIIDASGNISGDAFINFKRGGNDCNEVDVSW